MAQSIAIGVGQTAPTLGDSRLAFEVGRSNIVLTSYDFANDRLVFKAPLPEEYAGSVYEVAIFSASADDVAGEFGSRMISTFDAADEEWTNVATSDPSTFSTGTGRIGDDSLRHNPAAGTSVTDALSGLSLDLSGYSGQDNLVIALNNTNSFLSSIGIQFMTDSANYYTLTTGALATGYLTTPRALSGAVATGTPNWSNITEIRITTTSAAGGAALVDFDGLRIEDRDTINEEYVMVAREVLLTPFVKEAGMVQEVEFTLDVNL